MQSLTRTRFVSLLARAQAKPNVLKAAPSLFFATRNVSTSKKNQNNSKPHLFSSPFTNKSNPFAIDSMNKFFMANYATSNTAGDIQMRREKGNYKLPITLTSGEVRVFSLQENKEVSSFVADLKHEDQAIKEVVVLDLKGRRVALSTPIQELLKADWQVRINNKTYQVHSPPRSLVGGDHAELLGVDKSQLQRVRDALTAKGAQQQTITLGEYQVLAEDLGLNKAEAHAVLSDLHGLGVVLYFENNQELKNTVFLQPKKISQQIEEALNLPYIRVSHQEKIKLVQQLKEQLMPLEAARQSLEDVAWRRSNTWAWGGLLFLCAQFVLFARLTWWDSDWDVMEPITYFTTVTETVMAGYLYYILTSTEYTNDDARTILYKRKLKKLIQKNGFDDEQYQGLKQQIKELVNEIKFFDPKVAAELEVQQ
eukprot:TRINITY_DN487_c0_g1_i1.p1 TRINITY_DN487_c0_g1~~TRINITY_DN487_c0_g1_i1.p1  ORF type:complete len:443 (+),score=148.55 TRINITY_DN487_c0_g1_i1:59-1330(+)